VTERAAVDVALLRRRPQYALLFCAQTISLFGTMVTVVAVPYQIFALTRSSLAVGFLGVAELAPALVLALVGGALADAYDRRRLVQASEAALGLCAAALAVSAATHAGVWPPYLIVAVIAGLDALQRPALDATLPRLVERDEIPAAAALNSMRGTFAMVAGPALGGVLIAVFGLPLTYAFDALTLIRPACVSSLVANMMYAISESSKPRGENDCTKAVALVASGCRK